MQVGIPAAILVRRADHANLRTLGQSLALPRQAPMCQVTKQQISRAATRCIRAEHEPAAPAPAKCLTWHGVNHLTRERCEHGGARRHIQVDAQMDGAARWQVVATPKMRPVLEPAAPAMVDTKPGRHFRDPVVAEPRIVERICRAAVGEFGARKGIESDLGPAFADQIGEDPGNVVHHSAVYGVSLLA